MPWFVDRPAAFPGFSACCRKATHELATALGMVSSSVIPGIFVLFGSVSCSLRDREVGSSNPLAPTIAVAFD